MPSGHRKEIENLRAEHGPLSAVRFRMEIFGADAENDLLTMLTAWGVPVHTAVQLPSVEERLAGSA